VTDFATSDGGGNFTSTDSFLRVGFTDLFQANGFLYLIADSSINYISGVQTAGTPPTTTFTNQNANPEVGTPWSNAIDLWGTSLIFANTWGVQISFGSTVQKISEALDGVYTTVFNFGGLALSTAKAIVFGKKIWMVLAPIIDPISNTQVNKLLIWNGKIWWASTQSVALTFINNQEINSVITAYGTNGTAIYPLFQQPSTSFTKTVQSKFWAAPGGYQFIKTINRLWAIFQYIKSATVSVTASIDSEINSSSATYTSPTQTILVKNASGVTIPTKNASLVTIPVVSIFAGIWVLPPTAVGQQGVLLGMTISTTEGDISLLTAMMQSETQMYRG